MLEIAIAENTAALKALTAVLTNGVSVATGGTPDAAAPAKGKGKKAAEQPSTAATGTPAAGPVAPVTAPSGPGQQSTGSVIVDPKTYSDLVMLVAGGKYDVNPEAPTGRNAAVAHLARFGANRCAEVKEIDRNAAFADIKRVELEEKTRQEAAAKSTATDSLI